jgi:hypothetical protein
MAFVRVGQFEAQSESRDQLVAIYEIEAIPVIRAAPGHQPLAGFGDLLATGSTTQAAAIFDKKRPLSACRAAPVILSVIGSAACPAA